MWESETAEQALAAQEEFTPPPDLRSLEEIKEEIVHYQTCCEQLYLKMGRLLLEAKQHFGKYGDWLDWLRDNVDISICKAQRLMKVAAWMDQNTAPVPHLPFSKAYILSRLSPHDLEKFLGILHLTKQPSGNRMRLPIKTLLEKDGLTKRELEKEVRDFLRKGSNNRSAAQASNQTENHPPKQGNLSERFDQIRDDMNELAGLVESNSGDYALFAKKLCELCQDIVQRLSPEDLEDS